MVQVHEDERIRLRWEGEVAPHVPLWDVVDQSWTKPVERGVAMQVYLRLVVSKCSACTWTNTASGKVEAHVRKALEDGRAHREGGFIDSIGSDRVPRKQCNACGAMVKPSDMAAHRDAYVRALNTHEGVAVSEVVMQRYALAPVGVVPMRTQPVAMPEPSNGQGPVAEVGGRRRHRKRSRQRHKEVAVGRS